MAADNLINEGARTAPPARRPIDWQALLVPLTILAMILASVRAFFPGWGTPLWLDETYTAVIATQRDVPHLIDWCLHELSGPVYYSLMWSWAHMFGASATSLRIPSLICAVATPLLILWKGHPSRDVRMLWAVLVALWLPGVTFPSEARPYALLMLLSTAQAILFYRLIETGGRRNAFAWALVSATLLLTHYHTFPVTGAQGLIYLVLRRHELTKTWPAALAFVPVPLWMSFHIPFVLGLMKPGVSWFSTLMPSDIGVIPFVLMGSNPVTGLLLIITIAMMTAAMVRACRSKNSTPYDVAELATVGASMAAALLIITVGFFKPVFGVRYCVPFMPGLFFGLSVWVVAAARRFVWLQFALIASTLILGVVDLNDRVRNPTLDIRNAFSWEKASIWLRQQGARRLVFFWDNTSASLSTTARTGEVGSYFLHRDGWLGQVIVPPIAGKSVDPNVALAAIASQPGDAIIWAYDRVYGNSLAVQHHPMLVGPKSPFDCRDYGARNVSIITCIRR